MPTVERTIEVNTPLEQVWNYVTDFTHTEEWDPPTKSCNVDVASGDEGKGVGTVYKNVSSVAGSDVDITYTVLEYTPHRTFQIRGETGSMTLLDTLTFEEVSAGTRLTYHAEFEPHGAAKLAEPLMPLGLKRLGDKTADSLQETLEHLGGAPGV